MSPMHFPDLPLRTRVLVVMAVGLIPLLAVAIGAALILQHSADTLRDIVEQPVHRFQLTSRLQSQVLKTLALVKDRSPARDRDWREHLEAEVQRVEAGFDDMLVNPLLRPPERALLTIARDEWRYGLARNGGRLSGAPNLEKGGTQEQRLQNTAYVLEQIHDIYQREIGDQRAEMEVAKRRFLQILAIVVAGALVGVVTGGVWLVRSVLLPLHELAQGVEHFVHDDLGYRLPRRRHDELGRLAEEFNSMANHLQVQQQRLQELSQRDGLTGLYNRREFDRRLGDELQRARRYDRSFAILMLDIDHFKLVNDHYGHQAGDEVLQTVADLILLNVRPVDSVCRYGGEELAVILPETGEDGAAMVAERIRDTVAGAGIASPAGDTIHVTISIGVAGFPQAAAGAVELVGAADAALYAAKRDGRNRVYRH
ncbi:MAG: sensor domain-containing diguanylate cyclase [Gammaproteobacteria bacterium]|nr:sensor domain-containing diguanylate cyclase [Gammaproteobacteria bacterium]